MRAGSCFRILLGFVQRFAAHPVQAHGQIDTVQDILCTVARTFRLGYAST